MKLPTGDLKLPKVDFNPQKIVEDFKQMPYQDPGFWGLAPRIAVLLLIFVVICVLAYLLVWSGELDNLEVEKGDTVSLKEEYKIKKVQALQINTLRGKLRDSERKLESLLKQLPTKTEMESLLIDINQAGVGRGLAFGLFRPSKDVASGLYVELPVAVKLTGKYHDFGGFVADIARLPRIVTFNDINISSPKRKARSSLNKSSDLNFSFTIKTFRSPDEAEAMAARKAKKAATKGRQ